MPGLKIVNYVGELNICIVLDNGYMLSIMYKHVYNRYKVLHKCQKIPTDNMIIHIGNGDIPSTFNRF